MFTSFNGSESIEDEVKSIQKYLNDCNINKNNIESVYIANSKLYRNALNFAADIISLLSFQNITLGKPFAIFNETWFSQTFRNLFKNTISNIK